MRCIIHKYRRDIWKIKRVLMSYIVDYINNDTMYIKFHTGGLFEPEVFGKSMQLDKLREYCDIIEKVKNITENICNIIYNTDM